jgi:hypothetical protein
LARIEHGCELGEEEGIPIGALVENGHGLRAQGIGEGQLDETLHLLAREPLEFETPGRGPAGEFAERGGPARVAKKLHFPISPDHENPRPPEFPGDELEEEPGRIISPVEIVQDQDDRLTLARSLPEAGHAVEETKARWPGLENRRCCRVRVTRMDLRGDLSQVAGPVSKEFAEPRRLARSGVGAKELHPRPEDGSALCFGATAQVGNHRLLADEAREFLHRAGLSDAGLAAQEHQPATPVGRRAKCAFEVANELPASDEGRGDRLGPFLDLGHLRDESHPAAAKGLEDGWATRIVPQHSSGLIQRLVERLIADDGLRPYVRQQLLSGDDAPPEADQVEEEIQHLLLYRNESAISAKLAEVRVQLEFFEPNLHRQPGIRREKRTAMIPGPAASLRAS